MKRTALLLCATLCLMTACKRMSLGPYRNYQLTNDEAVPASKVGGAPYRAHR